MRPLKSIRLYKYQEKVFILQFEIEPMEYKRRKHSFVTDMYVNMLQWEELYNEINDVLSETLKIPDWKNGKLEGTCKVTELYVEYQLIEKERSLVNYEKLSYQLDWFMKIKIQRQPKKSKDKSSPSPDESTSKTKKRSKHKSQDLNGASCSSSNSEAINLSDTIIENGTSEIITVPSGGLNDEADYCWTEQHKQKRQKLIHTPIIIKNEDPQTPRTRSNIPKKASNQPSITNFMKPNERSPIKKRAKVKEEPTTSSKLKTGGSVMADLMDGDKRQQMATFLEKSNLDKAQKEVRKKELKNFKVLQCSHLSKEEIIEMINDMDKFILRKYTEISNGTTTLVIKGSVIPSFLVTTSNILGENQNLAVLDQIGKVCDKFENRLSNEYDFLHEIIFPAVIIEIFKKTHNLTTTQAITHIKTQEEYFSYYNLDTTL